MKNAEGETLVLFLIKDYLKSFCRKLESFLNKYSYLPEQKSY